MTDSVDIATEIEPLASEWEDLATQLGASPFSMPGWIRAWCDAFSSDQLAVVCVRRHGRLVGVLPLRSRRGSLLSPTNWHTPEFRPLAEDRRALQAMLSQAFARTYGRLDLSFIDSDDPILDEAESGFNDLAHLETRVIQRSPYLALDGDWDDQLAALPARRRSKLRRARQRIEDEGELSFTIEDGSGGLEQALSEGFAIEASGWKGEAGTAIVSSPSTLRFYNSIARWAAERGWLRLVFLRIDERAVAFGFGIEDRACHYDLKNGFDQAAARLSPGIVLAGERIKRAFDAGLDRYEFLGGPDRHKLIWTSSCHSRVRVQAFPNTAYGRLQRLTWVEGRRWGRRASTVAGRAAGRLRGNRE